MSRPAVLWGRLRNRPLVVAGGVGVLILAVMLTVVLANMSGSDGPSGPADPAEFAQGDADRIAADIASGDEARIRQAIAIPEGQALDPGAAAQLVQLQVQLDASTRQVNEDGLTTVAGTVTDGSGVATPALFYLVQVGGTWLIAEVVPQ